MGSQGIFSGTISVLEKNLDLRSLKQNLIVSNIANKDTPNYKAFDLSVEEELGKLTDTEASEKIKKTHPAHFSISEIDKDSSEIRFTPASNGFVQSGDGNTVDVEGEMINMAENTLLYETMSQLIRNKFQNLKIAIQGGK